MPNNVLVLECDNDQFHFIFYWIIDVDFYGLLSTLWELEWIQYGIIYHTFCMRNM